MIRRNSMLWAVLALTAVCLFFLSNHGIAKSSAQQKDTAKEKTPQNTLKNQETKPTDPFTIQKLSLKDNKIQVTVQAAAGVDVSSGKYTIIKLKIEPQLGKGKQEWLISEVYGKGTPAIRAGEVVFNTGLNITEQQLITATLYGGGWQTVKRERLGLALAKTTTRAFQPGSQSKEAPLRDKTSWSLDKDISKFVPSRQRIPMLSGDSHGIQVFSPSRGAYYHFGDTISVWWLYTERWTATDGDPSNDTCRVTLRRDSLSEGAFDHVLYDGGIPTPSGGIYQLPLTLPAEPVISEAHDYYIHVATYTTDEPLWGDSQAFSIGDPLDPGVDWRDREPVVLMLRPRGGETWHIGRTYEVRWVVWPRELPAVDAWDYAIITESISSGFYRWTGRLHLDDDMTFDNATREYSAQIEVPSTFYGGHSGPMVVALGADFSVPETGERYDLIGLSNTFEIAEYPRQHGIAITIPRRGYRLYRGHTYEVYWHFTGDAPECGTFGTVTPSVSISLYHSDLSGSLGRTYSTQDTIYSYALPADTPPGEYVFVITQGGQYPPQLNQPADQACMWAISEPFTVLEE